MRPASVLAAVLAAAAVLPAQGTTVVPAKYAKTEAGSWTAWPFGLSSAARLQYLYDASLFGTPAAPIRRLAFRGNGGRPAPAKSGVDLQISMSTTKVGPWNATTTFARNHGADRKVVFKRKKVNLPAQRSTPRPARFLTKFPLDAVFVYVQARGNFLVDYQVFAQPRGTYSHDTAFVIQPKHAVIGSGCGGLTQTVSGGLATRPGARLTYRMRGGPSGGTAFHLLGDKRLKAPIKLPLGGCPLYQSILVATSSRISASGGTSVSFPLQRWFSGVTLLSQFAAIDPARRRLATSRAYRTRIGGYEAHTRIYHLSSATASTGRVQVGVGIVSELAF